MNQERRKAPVQDQDLILGDGTKCHGLGGKKNEINIVLGKNQATGEKSFLGFDVNGDWKETLGILGVMRVLQFRVMSLLFGMFFLKGWVIIRLVFVTVLVMYGFIFGVLVCQRRRGKRLQVSL
jgi:hypothetical protein